MDNFSPPKSNLTCFLFVCCVLEDVCLNPHRALWLSPQEELNHSYENIKMQKHHTKTKKKREATFVCAGKRNIEEQKSSVLFARFYIVCLITVYGCLGSNILDIQSCMRMQRFLVFFPMNCTAEKHATVGHGRHMVSFPVTIMCRLYSNI